MGKKTFTDESGKVYTAKEKKPFYKKVWFWGLVIIVVIIIAAVSGGGGDDSTTSNDTANDSNDSAATEKTTEEESMPGIGEELKVGNVVFKVNGTSTATNVGGEYGSDAQGTYLILDVEVRNEGTEAITMDSSFFKLKANGKEYESDSTAGLYANEQADFFLTSINPDLSLTGKVVFDVSDEVLNADEQILEVQTGVFGTEMGQINLK